MYAAQTSARWSRVTFTSGCNLIQSKRKPRNSSHTFLLTLQCSHSKVKEVFDKTCTKIQYIE